MDSVLAILAGFGLSVLLATVVGTLFLRYFTKTPNVTIVGGGLLVPLLLFGWGLYDIALNLEVGSPPPGMLLIGGLVLAVIMIPCTILVSFLTVRFCEKRLVRNTR